MSIHIPTLKKSLKLFKIDLDREIYNFRPRLESYILGLGQNIRLEADEVEYSIVLEEKDGQAILVVHTYKQGTVNKGSIDEKEVMYLNRELPLITVEGINLTKEGFLAIIEKKLIDQKILDPTKKPKKP